MGVYDVPFHSEQFYDHKARWIHYFHQIRAVRSELRENGGDLDKFSVLEIGPSHGLVTGYLRKFGVKVTTLDIKPEYTPDVVGDVCELPFADDSFSMAIACEVLEHMPFTDSLKALRELRRVVKRTIFISVPDARRTLLQMRLKLPFCREISLTIRVPTLQRQIVTVARAHNWEIGKRGYPPSYVRSSIRRAGFRILREGSLPDTPRNYYFLLEKI
ncbi:MAG: class I SAM-dependent methyltransferase [Patescibacteria group bacterium]|mgnify:CR=1 FL=1